VLYDGLRQVVDTALLHLGCVRFPVTGPGRYSMTAREAVQLCRRVRPRTDISVHYEGLDPFPPRARRHRTEIPAGTADIGRRLQWLPIGSAVSIAG
jgi:hypothetical protein